MLDKNTFKSIFKSELDYFIKYKRSSGLKYNNEVYRLKHIDNILYDLNLKSQKITKDTFDKLTVRNNMYGENYARQYGVTKDFCKFLISYGYKQIYYEEKKFQVINNYQPIIFSSDEIVRLFQNMDYFTKNNMNKKYYRLYYTYSILFRLLYACGLRIAEVVKINIEDINFDENTINVINSKRNVSRIVVFSKSMKKCLIDYINKFNIKYGLLFRNTKNNVIKTNGLRDYYKLILKKAHLNVNTHIHDLRHCFANNALNQMLERGYDENVVIVYLYKYMGHKYIAETEYYLHFTDYNKQKLIANNDTFSKELYKGVDLEDE